MICLCQCMYPQTQYLSFRVQASNVWYVCANVFLFDSAFYLLSFKKQLNDMLMLMRSCSIFSILSFRFQASRNDMFMLIYSCWNLAFDLLHFKHWMIDSVCHVFLFKLSIWFLDFKHQVFDMWQTHNLIFLDFKQQLNDLVRNHCFYL